MLRGALARALEPHTARPSVSAVSGVWPRRSATMVAPERQDSGAIYADWGGGGHGGSVGCTVSTANRIGGVLPRQKRRAASMNSALSDTTVVEETS
jgi:hypothetical protein